MTRKQKEVNMNTGSCRGLTGSILTLCLAVFLPSLVATASPSLEQQVAALEKYCGGYNKLLHQHGYQRYASLFAAHVAPVLRRVGEAAEAARTQEEAGKATGLLLRAWHALPSNLSDGQILGRALTRNNGEIVDIFNSLCRLPSPGKVITEFERICVTKNPLMLGDFVNSVLNGWNMQFLQDRKKQAAVGLAFQVFKNLYRTSSGRAGLEGPLVAYMNKVKRLGVPEPRVYFLSMVECLRDLAITASVPLIELNPRIASRLRSLSRSRILLLVGRFSSNRSTLVSLMRLVRRL